MPTTSAKPSGSASTNGSHAKPGSGPAGALQPSDTFVHRHIGPDEHEQSEMLTLLGYGSLEQLSEAAVPAAIRMSGPLALDGIAGGTRERGEFEVQYGEAGGF